MCICVFLSDSGLKMTQLQILASLICCGKCNKMKFTKTTMIITVTCSTEAALSCEIKTWKKKSQGDQLPDGLITQLIEHCISIAEVVGLNPVHVWIFFHFCCSCCVYVVVQFFFWFKNIWNQFKFFEPVQISWTSSNFLNQDKIFWTGTKCFNLGQFVST